MTNTVQIEFVVQIDDDGNAFLIGSNGVVIALDSKKPFPIDSPLIFRVLIKIIGVLLANSPALISFLSTVRDDDERSSPSTDMIDAIAREVADRAIMQEAYASGDASPPDRYVEDGLWIGKVERALQERINESR